MLPPIGIIIMPAEPPMPPVAIIIEPPVPPPVMTIGGVLMVPPVIVGIITIGALVEPPVLGAGPCITGIAAAHGGHTAVPLAPHATMVGAAFGQLHATC